ncbi:MAG TPA: hypothetical protein PKK99_04850 [Bacteroidia bacterium]|mgnify:CR=1 FL=1|nr:hypothetical protein [Bacteroidia bacterium]
MISRTLLYLSTWNFVRVLRLILGITLLVQTIQNKDLFSGVIGGFLLFQAITNTGCCGVSNCGNVSQNTSEDSNLNPEYIEIKARQNQENELK